MAGISGAPKGTRTPVTAVRGRCLNRLTMGAYIDKFGLARWRGLFGCGTRIRTQTIRVRVVGATVTPFRIICFLLLLSDKDKKHYSGKSLVCQYFFDSIYIIMFNLNNSSFPRCRHSTILIPASQQVGNLLLSSNVPSLSGACYPTANPESRICSVG